MARKGTKKRVILFIVELLILLLLIGGLFVYGQINSRLNQIEGEELDNVEMNVVTSEKVTSRIWCSTTVIRSSSPVSTTTLKR